MNRQPIRGTIKRQRQVSTKDRYSQAQEKYLNGQFTYDTHCLILNLTQKGRKEPHMQGVPLYKTLIQISKLLMLNQLEILFLGATIEEMKWKIIDNCLNPYVDDFKGLCDTIKNDTYNKKVQLSLLLIGYVVKVYLNENQETTPFQYRIRQIITKDYDKMYQEWVQKMKKNFKFSPKYVNKIFKEMDIIKTKKQSQLNQVNYNSKVEQLFKIFVDSDHKNQHNYHSKHNKQQQQQQSLQPEYEQIPQQGGFIPLARAESLQSLRSFGRRESQKSQLEFGGYGLRNLSSIFRNNSLDDN